MLRWLKLAAVLTLWAFSFILNEVALRSMDAVVVVAGRWTVTAALTWLLLARRGQLERFGAALRVDWRHFFVLSLVGVTLLYGLQVVGQSRTSAVNAGLLANMVPVFTALLATTVLHKRLRGIGWLGIVVALAGAWVVSVAQQPADEGVSGLGLKRIECNWRSARTCIFTRSGAILHIRQPVAESVSAVDRNCGRRDAGCGHACATRPALRPRQHNHLAGRCRRRSPGHRPRTAGQPVVVGNGRVARREPCGGLHLPDSTDHNGLCRADPG